MRAILPSIYKHLELPDTHYWDVERMLSGNLGKTVCWLTRKRGHAKKIYTASVYGTVFSGHPTRTTFGNSMRVALYILFTTYAARIPSNHFAFFVGGDDVQVFVSRRYFARFHD
jgi:hypothetical protein